MIEVQIFGLFLVAALVYAIGQLALRVHRRSSFEEGGPE